VQSKTRAQNRPDVEKPLHTMPLSSTQEPTTAFPSLRNVVNNLCTKVCTQISERFGTMEKSMAQNSAQFYAPHVFVPNVVLSARTQKVLL
jgi:hypothetical protein